MHKVLKYYPHHNHIKIFINKKFGINYCTEQYHELNKFEFYRHGLLQKFSSGYDFNKILSDVEKISPALESKIPFKYHIIWIAKPNKAQEISEKTFEVILANQEFLINLYKGWEFNFWTDNINNFPKTVTKLMNNNWQIKEYSNYKNDFYNISEVDFLRNDGKIGIAVDRLRIEIVNKFGGMYSDLNFKFEVNFLPHLFKYDFVSVHLSNNFFASKAEHIILDYYLKELSNNINKDYPYFHNIDSIFDETILKSFNLFSISFLLHANSDENKDFLNVKCVDDYLKDQLSFGDAYENMCYSLFPLAELAYFLPCQNYSIGYDGADGSWVTWA